MKRNKIHDTNTKNERKDIKHSVVSNLKGHCGKLKINFRDSIDTAIKNKTRRSSLKASELNRLKKHSKIKRKYMANSKYENGC